MQVIFYNFNKRINSTARPPQTGRAYDCIIKDGSSQLSPTISLVWPSGTAPVFNYAYIAQFGARFYFVSDWTFYDRQWTAKLSVDVLATYKTNIGDLTKYILRSASAENADALDSMYPSTADYYYNFKVGNFTNWGNYGVSNSGVYVITCVGDNDVTNATGVTQYQLTGGEVALLIKNAINAVSNEWNTVTVKGSVEEAIKDLLLMPFRFFTDLSQYIRNIMWFPCSFVVNSAATSAQIRLGMYPVTTAKYKPLMHPRQTEYYDIDLAGLVPSTYKSWEALNPYGCYTLEAQPWGVIELGGMDIIKSDKLRVRHNTDAMSGLSRLDVSAVRGNVERLLTTRTAQLGVAVPYGGTAPDYAGAIRGGAEIAASAAAFAAGDVGGGALAASITSAVAATTPTGYSAGTSGGGASIAPFHTLHARILHHVDTDPTELGYPLCEMRQISTLSGYIKVQDGDITGMTAFESELMQVKSYLEGGFFYE